MSDSAGKKYVDRSVEDARELAKQNGVKFRVGSEDGEMYMLTQDWVPGRITASVTNGIVINCSVEGE